jgi:hypothetical protein
MGVGASLVLIALGAILTFAVHVTNHTGINIHTIGVILMIVGGLGFLVSMAFWSSWGGLGGSRTTVGRTGGVVEREREYL